MGLPVCLSSRTLTRTVKSVTTMKASRKSEILGTEDGMSNDADAEAAKRLLAECDVTPLRVSGPGGQHRNRRESGIRLVHRPTGLVVMATERRSQFRNKSVALERMAKKLAERRRRKKPRRATKPTAGARERRLEDKKHRAGAKRTRKNVAPADEQ